MRLIVPIAVVADDRKGRRYLRLLWRFMCCLTDMKNRRKYRDQIDEVDCPHCGGSGETGRVGDICALCKGSCVVSHEIAIAYNEKYGNKY